jgi:SHO1 osmosensor
LVGFLAAALSFTTSITNTLIYSPRASDEAAASGHLFLSIINVIAPPYSQLTKIVWIFYFGTTSAAAPHAWVDSYAITRSRPITSTPQMSSTAPFTSLQPNYNNPTTPTYAPQSSLVKRETFPESRVDSVIEEPTSYPHRAKAIYAYEADMKDPNEISFAKGEVLEISADITSKWWTVRKADGTRGIAPSNYLSLES